MLIIREFQFGSSVWRSEWERERAKNVTLFFESRERHSAVNRNSMNFFGGLIASHKRFNDWHHRWINSMFGVVLISVFIHHFHVTLLMNLDVSRRSLSHQPNGMPVGISSFFSPYFNPFYFHSAKTFELVMRFYCVPNDWIISKKNSNIYNRFEQYRWRDVAKTARNEEKK